MAFSLHSFAFGFLLVIIVRSQSLTIPFPPPARVGSSYSHSFPQSSLFPPFTSENATAYNYTLDQAPKWLSLAINNASSDPILAISGNPLLSDARSSWVRIIRKSSANPENITQRGFRISVSKYPSPTLTVPFSSQLSAEKGPLQADISSAKPLVGTSSPGVIVPPSWSFSIGFRENTFASQPGADLYYYAALNGDQPLPSWITFYNATLTFSGTAPRTNPEAPLGQFFPQIYNITLYCTDFPNTLANTSDSFLVVVTATGSEVLAGVNTTVGNAVEVDVQGVLLKMVLEGGGNQADLDGAEISVDTSIAPWLAWDGHKRLSGVVPQTYITNGPTIVNLPISLRTQGTTMSLALFLPIHVLPYPFRSVLPFNATLPEELRLTSEFEVDLSAWLVADDQVVTIRQADNSSWATKTYLQPNKTLRGVLPSQAVLPQYQQSELLVTAFDPISNVSASNSLFITLPPTYIVDPHVQTPNTTIDQQSSAAGLSRGGVIAISTVLSTIGLLVLAFILFICIHRRHISSSNPDQEDGRHSAMDFMDVLRDSYIYCRPRRSSQYTSGTTVVGGSSAEQLGGSKESLPVEKGSLVRQLSRPAKALLKDGRASVEPNFDMVGVPAGPKAPFMAGSTQSTPTSFDPGRSESTLARLERALAKPLFSSPQAPNSASASPSPARPRFMGLFNLASNSSHDTLSSQNNSIDQDLPRRMGLMKAFRNDKSNPQSPRINISKPQPHPNEAYRPEASSINASATPRSPSGDFFNSQSDRELAGPRTQGHLRDWSSSRFSANTFSTTGTTSWESEEAWRQQKRAGKGSPARIYKKPSPWKFKSKPSPARSMVSVTKGGTRGDSRGVTMAERLRLRMLRVGEELTSSLLTQSSSPSSVVPRRRRDFGPAVPRPKGAVFEGDVDGELVVREEDVFGVVRSVPKQPHRSTSEMSGSLKLHGATGEAIGRSFPDERLGSPGMQESEDEVDVDAGSLEGSYHRATLVPVRSLAVQQKLVQKIARHVSSEMYGEDALHHDQVPSPVMFTPAITYPSAAVARRSSETHRTSESMGIEFAARGSEDSSGAGHSSSGVIIRSSPVIASPHAITLGSSTTLDRLRGLGYPSTVYSAVTSKNSPTISFIPAGDQPTIRLVDCTSTIALSPDSVSSAIMNEAMAHMRPSIFIQDTSDQYNGIPVQVINAGRPFAFHPSIPTSSGRSTPLSFSSASSRAKYEAFMGDGRQLPHWLHFDSDAVEFWGKPEVENLGSVSVKVVERVSAFKELGRLVSGRSMADDLNVVARLILVVSCELLFSTMTRSSEANDSICFQKKFLSLDSLDSGLITFSLLLLHINIISLCCLLVKSPWSIR